MTSRVYAVFRPQDLPAIPATVLQLQKCYDGLSAPSPDQQAQAHSGRISKDRLLQIARQTGPQANENDWLLDKVWQEDTEPAVGPVREQMKVHYHINPDKEALQFRTPGEFPDQGIAIREFPFNSLVAWDELFIGFGKQLNLNIFDQNRAFMGVVKKIYAHFALSQILQPPRGGSNQALIQYNAVPLDWFDP
jgi:hypothetical protein